MDQITIPPVLPERKILIALARFCRPFFGFFGESCTMMCQLAFKEKTIRGMQTAWEEEIYNECQGPFHSK